MGSNGHHTPAAMAAAVSLKGGGPMAAHSIVSTTFKPADGSGNIDGWESRCSCGFHTGSSLGERWARRQGWEHVEYMQRKAK